MNKNNVIQSSHQLEENWPGNTTITLLHRVTTPRTDAGISPATYRDAGWLSTGASSSGDGERGSSSSASSE